MTKKYLLLLRIIVAEGTEILTHSQTIKSLFMTSIATSKDRKLRVLALILITSLSACGGKHDAQTSVQHFAAAPLSTTAAKIENFPGKRNQYQILATANGFIVRDLVGNESTREVNGADALKFADLSINLQIGVQAKSIPQTALNNLIELYVAFFNRVPDSDGLAYWIRQYKDGATLNSIADSFYQAALQYSSSTGYTVNQSNADFVKLIYKNVLGRTGPTEPPAPDVQYWVDQIDKGIASKSSLVISMLNSAHSFEGDTTFGWVPKLLNNKIATAKFFSIEQGINYLTPEESIKKGMEIAAAVTPDSNNMAKILTGVSDLGFKLSGEKSPEENLNSVGILSNTYGKNYPFTVSLQLDSNGNITGGNYDFQSLRDSMTPCVRTEDNFFNCLGTKAAFSYFEQSNPLSLAGAIDTPTSLSLASDAENYFTGTITGSVWSGTWGSFSKSDAAYYSGKFSVIVNFTSPKFSTISYNIQDLMLQFYSQHRVWQLKENGTSLLNGMHDLPGFPATPDLVSGTFETTPSAKDGVTLTFDGQILQPMDISLKLSNASTTYANTNTQHLFYYPLTGQLGLGLVAGGGMESFPDAKNPAGFFPTSAKIGDSGNYGVSEYRAFYPSDKTITSKFTYRWNLKTENGRDLLCQSRDESVLPVSPLDDRNTQKTIRCHQINPNGKLGEFMSYTRIISGFTSPSKLHLTTQ